MLKMEYPPNIEGNSYRKRIVIEIENIDPLDTRRHFSGEPICWSTEVAIETVVRLAIDFRFRDIE